MPPFFTIGSLSFPWLTLGAAAALAVFFVVSALLEKTKDVGRFWRRRVALSLALALLVWKLAPVFYRFGDILGNPGLILSLNGGLPALVGGLFAGAGFLALSLVQIRKEKGVPLAPSLVSLGTGLGVFLLSWGILAWVTPPEGVPSPALTARSAQVRSLLLDDLQGKKHALEEYKGKVAVVNFWGTWCPPCRADFPEFREALARNLSKTVLIGVNLVQTEPGGLDEVNRFVVQSKLTWTQLVDSEGLLAQNLDIRAIPATAVFDPSGKLVELRTGTVDVGWLVSLEKKYAP